jgi:hypothetical protein
VYTPYLMGAYAAALLLVLLGFRVIRRGAPQLRGLAHLRRFILCDLIAVLLLALRLRAPALLTIVAPNLLLYAGLGYLYCATAEILEVRPRQAPWIGALCTAALPPLLWFTYVRNQTLGRLEVHCLVMVAILAMSTVLLFRETRPVVRDPARACAWLMTASIALNVLWGVFALAHGSQPNFMHPDAMDARAR